MAGSRAPRKRVAEATGPAADEVEPGSGSRHELRRGRPEIGEKRLQAALAAEELAEYLHARPCRPRREPADRAEPVGCGRSPIQESGHDLLDLSPRPRRDEERALAHGMRAEDEPRRDPEVAAPAASAGPVQITVTITVGDDDGAVGRDDLG